MVNNIYQAKYVASELTKNYALADFEKLIPVFMSTGINIYPHQIVAALNALHNPFSKGYILCDEVGLGKGIEAMLVVSKNYYDNKRKIAIIVPQPLLNQWKVLLEKQFDLPFIIFEEGVILNEEILKDNILLTTYKFASDNYFTLKDFNWDLVVFEEAHKLRKHYTGQNKTSNNLHDAFETTKKLLLTATPMQKNVMDLYGLINFIDERILCQADEFYKRYYKKPENYEELREILKPYTFRTLRTQVKADVSLPERIILTHEYELEDPKEKRLNELLTKYITKPKKLAFPEMDTYELNLMFQKIYSSSIYAISKTLAGVYVRLNKMGNSDAINEAKEIKDMLELATSIRQTSKGKTFLNTLEQSFKTLQEKGQNKKIIVFTENTQTQEYLQKLISKNTKYRSFIYNGSTGEQILEDFKNKGHILIATDNANEGFNFEFCNMIINYDNPLHYMYYREYSVYNIAHKFRPRHHRQTLGSVWSSPRHQSALR